MMQRYISGCCVLHDIPKYPFYPGHARFLCGDSILELFVFKTVFKIVIKNDVTTVRTNGIGNYVLYVIFVYGNLFRVTFFLPSQI